MPIGVVIGLVSAILTALVTEIYCHRYLAHRAFSMHPVLASLLEDYFQITGGAHPETWAAIHRLHHRYADTPLDPHSPLQRRPWMVLLGTPYLFAMARRRLPANTAPGTGLAHLGLRGLVIAFFFLTCGLVQLLTMLAVHLICYLGIMGMVNSVGHVRGRKPHPDVPGYDIAWLAIPLLGHGYHNSHHAHPAASRTGLLDPVWPLLRLLAVLGLVELQSQRGFLIHPCIGSSIQLASGSQAAHELRLPTTADEQQGDCGHDHTTNSCRRGLRPRATGGADGAGGASPCHPCRMRFGDHRQHDPR